MYRFMRININRISRAYSDKVSNGPLTGIKIIDMTRVLEKPKVGDDTRHWGPPFVEPKVQDATKESAYFLSVNRNKKSITLNIKEKEGQEIIKKLASDADVFVENYLPNTLSKFNIGFKDLISVNPKLIYASITGYGQTGPYSNKPGYDVMVEAEAGLMYITGETSGPPCKVGVAITGLYTKGAILAALFERHRTGKGQHIDVSLIESQVASLVNLGSSYLNGNQEAQRWGTSHASIVPYRTYETKDGHIVLGAGNDQQFKKLVKLLSLEYLLENSQKYSINTERVKNRVELDEIIENRTKQENTDFWLKAFEGCGLPFSPINNLSNTFKHPQIIDRDMVRTMEHPTLGSISLIGLPVKYSSSKIDIRLPPPTLGQHTNEILKDLGYSENQIKSLRKNDII